MLSQTKNTQTGITDANTSRKKHLIFVGGFSLPFAYILSFLFEGRVLYSILDHFEIYFPTYIFATIVAHFLGLFLCGWFIKSQIIIQRMMFTSIILCFFTTLPFLFVPSVFWGIGLIISGFFSGCLMTTLGYYLKKYIRKKHRLKIVADILICSNVVMIIIYFVDLYVSSFVGLFLSLLCLLGGMAFLRLLIRQPQFIVEEASKTVSTYGVKQPLQILFVFVFIITINSGLMYQVINPQFNHLPNIVTLYWAIPYIIALAIMRYLPYDTKRSSFLYIALIMLMSAFVAFILLEHNVTGYLIINTLMLGSFGVFDLFWWSVLGEMLEYTTNPSKVFGIGLSANVLGVLVGGALGYLANQHEFSGTEITVLALVVLCITTLLLPVLNRQLVLLLKSHTYLAAYNQMAEFQYTKMIQETIGIEMLTNREKEVLEQILSGKTNRMIAQKLSITESTVKTHAGNIYSKYEVSTRAELISTLLKNHI
jgi:DNA-binding CsgD family transcriptional regulator/MFS family permease